MIDAQTPQVTTSGLTTHYYCVDTDEVKTDTLTPEYLSDLGTIILEPIEEPSVDLLEDYEESGETVVNISGLWYQVSAKE